MAHRLWIRPGKEALEMRLFASLLPDDHRHQIALSSENRRDDGRDLGDALDSHKREKMASDLEGQCPCAAASH